MESTNKQTDLNPTTPDEAVESVAEARADYRSILEREIHGGIRELRRAPSGLFMSAFSAGLDIGFGPLLVAVVVTLSAQVDTVGTRLLMAGAYGIGFILVIVGRSELFTEHTTMAVLPVLAGRERLSSLFRLWSLVYAGNLIGAGLFAAVVTRLTLEMNVVSESGYRIIAHAILDHEWWVIAGSAVLAGWLMGLLSWLASAVRETIGLVAVVWLVTGSIGFLGLHHSIAGSVEALFGLWVGTSTMGQFASFLAWSTVGNIIGGTVFVALLKFGHAVRSRREDDPALESEPSP